MEEIEAAVMAIVGDVLERLNQMREEEGRGIARELRERMAHLPEAAQERAAASPAGAAELLRTAEIARCRSCSVRASTRNGCCKRPRCWSIAATSRKRSSGWRTHVEHFLGLLDAGGEIGKKLDFLLQEMNREANTLLSKTSGLAGEALKITEAGLAMKSEIEKSREQVQNLE